MLARVCALGTVLLALLAVPALVAARLGADGGAVFGAAWAVALVPAVAATVIAGRMPLSVPGDLRRAVLERALTVVVPVVVVLLVGSPWILSAFGRHARDTGVGTLVLVALAAVPFTVVLVAALSAGRPVAAVAPTAVAAAVALGAGWVLLPVLGVLGGGFGWLAGQSAVAAVLLLRNRSMITRPVDAGHVTAG